MGSATPLRKSLQVWAVNCNGKVLRLQVFYSFFYYFLSIKYKNLYIVSKILKKYLVHRFFKKSNGLHNGRLRFFRSPNRLKDIDGWNLFGLKLIFFNEFYSSMKKNHLNCKTYSCAGNLLLLFLFFFFLLILLFFFFGLTLMFDLLNRKIIQTVFVEQ